MSEENIQDEEILTLPSSPVIYMSIMRTLKGKPISVPLWSSFENRVQETTLENESISSTFLSLARNMAEIAQDIEENGKILRIDVDKRIFNIYIPHPESDFQICFVIVFEEREHVVIEKKYRTELMNGIYDQLANIDALRDFINKGVEEQIDRESELYQEIMDKVEKKIKKWDKKRVKYLKSKKEEEKRKAEELRKMEEQLKLEDNDMTENEGI